MPGEVTLRPAEPEDRAYIERLLARNDLPIADISRNLDSLYVCETEMTRVGTGGLELYEASGLIRSIAIEEPARGNGYGTEVCNELVSRARSLDIPSVYLLTTTAAPFFERLDFETVSRDSAPPSIRNTSEFSELCPSTAVCMKRDLTELASPDA